MSESEIAWGKAHGLKKTNMRTTDYGLRGKYSTRIVYRADDGRLFYRDNNHWVGTFESYCYVPDKTQIRLLGEETK